MSFGSRKLGGLYLPNRPPGTLWDITLDSQVVQMITSHQCQSSISCQHQLLLPPLCHPHIHLDKPFLLSSNIGRYQDLAPKDGSFREALKNTAIAKSRFTAEDLYVRGSWLIDESIAAGVSAMRAFVEVDETVGLLCVETGLRLKREYEGHCFIQLCAFAQDPIFSGEHGENNRSLMGTASEMKGVDAIGTTPYVEESWEASMKNIEWAIYMALRTGLHLDFHLDYNLDSEKAPMIGHVVQRIQHRDWSSKSSKTISVGHCTKITQLSATDVESLANTICEAELPISFVGLPTSDIYMMGRTDPEEKNAGERVRGTMDIPLLIKKYGLNGAIGVNNVGNAFTPYGTLDPLWLACQGIGLYHRGTAEDAKLLFDCVSTRARRAIGLPDDTILCEEGQPLAGMLIQCQPIKQYRKSPSRQQTTIEELVWYPPSIERRHLIATPRQD